MRAIWSCPFLSTLLIISFQVKALVSTVEEILDFQQKFLKELEQIIDSETGFDAFDEIPQFQVFLVD